VLSFIYKLYNKFLRYYKNVVWDSKDGALPERSEGGESGEEVLNKRSEFRNLTPSQYLSH